MVDRMGAASRDLLIRYREIHSHPEEPALVVMLRGRFSTIT